MSENDALVLSHEERIQRSESFASEVAAQMAAMSEQLKAVGEKVEAVGAALGKDITSFREANTEDHESLRQEVEALKTKTEEHGKSLTLLLSDRAGREKRIKAARSAGVATLLTLLGAIATKWGEAIYNWLVTPGVHKGGG